MSTTKAEGKSQFALVAQQLSAGTAKHLTAATPVAFMGGSFTPAQITTELQQVVTLRSDVNTAKAAVTAKVATEKTDLPSLRTFIAAYKAYLKVAFGTSPDVLADFGLAPKARSTPHDRDQGSGGREAHGNARGTTHDGNGAKEGGQR